MTTNDPSMTYPIGRFAITVPQSMKAVSRTATFRGTEIKKQPWLAGVSHEKARQTALDSRVAQVMKLKASTKKPNPFIQQKLLATKELWAYGILYYRDGDTDDSVGVWEILADYGTHGAWFEYAGLLDGNDAMRDWILDIARAYKVIDPAAPLPKENGFYLEHGYIALPYLEQEETYARFEGHPLELKLEFKTTAVHKVSESGLVDRLAASLATNLAPGVDIDKLRTGKRSVAGITGEEVILRGTQDGNSELNFIWLFTGKADSGDAPKISIEMEAPDGQLEEKLKVWDALLNSFKPVGR